MNDFELENVLKPKVFIRIRPVEGKSSKAIKINEEDETIELRSNVEHRTCRQFVTNGIFFNKSQEDVYRSTIHGVFEGLQKGLNAIILAYGQTGSGKSLTINGLLNSPLDIGILPRLVGDLFKLSIENYTITLEMSLVELIDGFVNDLLENSANMSLNYKRFKIVDEFQTLKLLYSAEARKEFIKNENYFSNLHSSVTTFYITFRNTHLTNPEVFTSKIHLVDMAGVDTIGNFTCSNKNSKQIGMGNCTKTFFEQFLVFTANKTNVNRVWFKLHPLLSFLKDELKTNSLLRFIGHIYINDENLKISKSVLKFSEVLGLQIKARIVKIDRKSNESKLLIIENEFKKMREDQLLHKILLNQYECGNLGNERVELIKRTLTQYLENKSNELEVLEVADVKNILKTFREMFNSERPKSPKSRGKVSKSELSVTSKRSMSIQSVSKAKKSITNSKRSSANKRVSNASNTTLTSHRTSVQEQQIPIELIPDYLPEYQEVWLSYIQDPNTSFKCLLNEYVENESNVRTFYSEYLNEINALRDVRKEIDKEKHKLDEVSVRLRFDATVNCDYLKGIEGNLTNQLVIKERKVLDQQENVLKLQTDLKIHLNHRRGIKNRMRTDFETFSKKKFSTVVPELIDSQDDQLKEYTFDLNEENTVNREIMSEFQCGDELIDRFAKLKRIFETELRIQKRKVLQKQRKWVNT